MLDYVKTYDYLIGIPDEPGQVADTQQMLALITGDEMWLYDVTDEALIDKVTINTDDAAQPSTWFLTVHYADGSHQTDTYALTEKG